ncbi:MAG: peptidoglycan-binding domain-containing protein [Gemmiger formicilis]|uniref:peptidoglycan-binding domain-containing protein n=1 Tax=Gemmiger formicilis TaxID=745368 RepID=UPI003FED4E36|nr:peptidoglycan-binding domain-containing protein [Gemmiger formicilis]
MSTPFSTVCGPGMPGPYNALTAFQRSVGLTADGICGCNTWKKLTAASVGIGATKTVIDK